MYEISPYATFSMNGGRTVHTGHSKTPTRKSHTPSSLDYTMQFKTFGHPESDLNATAYPILPTSGFIGHVKGKPSWHKQRYYNTDGNKFDLISMQHSCKSLFYSVFLLKLLL
jgi:Down syndrome cell adhesion molecule